MEPIRDSLIHKIKNSLNNIETSLGILLRNTPHNNENYHVIEIALEEVENLITFLRQMEREKE